MSDGRPSAVQRSMNSRALATIRALSSPSRSSGFTIAAGPVSSACRRRSGVRVDHGIERGHLGLGGEARVEAVLPGRGVMGIVLRAPAPVRIHDVAGQGPQVPLPEEPGAPSRGAEDLAEVELLGVEMADVGPVDAHARGVAPGEDARTSRGADRRGGVEAAQLDAVAQSASMCGVRSDASRSPTSPQPSSAMRRTTASGGGAGAGSWKVRAAAVARIGRRVMAGGGLRLHAP